METDQLLGPLEHTIMEVLWEMRQATVREVHNQLSANRQIAYTTVLTVMGNLVSKGLLEKSGNGKSHTYSIVLTKEEFIERECNRAISDLLERFGDLAVANFLKHQKAGGDSNVDPSSERDDK